MSKVSSIYASSPVTVIVYGLERTIIPCEDKTEKLWPFAGNDVFIITAYNPKSEQLNDEENKKRNLGLIQDLMLIDPVQQLPTYGHDVEKNWTEHGFLIAGVSQREIVEIAKKYEQNAIYKLTPDEREVIPVLLDESNYSITGWKWETKNLS